MNIIFNSNDNSNYKQRGIQGGNIMNLINIFNVQSGPKERETAKSTKWLTIDRDYGYSVYEALEFNKNNQSRNSFGLQLQTLQDFNK